MGVLIDINDPNDKELFDDAFKEIEFIDTTSERFRFKSTPEKEIKKSTTPQKGFFKKVKSTFSNGSGHCIRCDAEVKLNPMVPYCKKCYSLWNKYKNPDYEENHCHICGKDNISTIDKPTCYPCFKSNKSKLEFAVG